MNWGNGFLAVMGVEYLMASFVFLGQKNWGYALTMFAYGVANFGLLWATK
jgi:hypothetical protein